MLYKSTGIQVQTIIAEWLCIPLEETLNTDPESFLKLIAPMHHKEFDLLTLYEMNQCITAIKQDSAVYYIINASFAEHTTCTVWLWY